MSIKDFVGNLNEVQSLYDWLNGFYNHFKNSNYVLLIASSGNGKSFLPKLLSQEFESELFEIQPSMITSSNDMNNILKSINISSLDYKRKLILIDDFDEFHFSYKKDLCSIPEISKYPVIFTSKSFDFPQELKYHSEKGPKNKWYHILKKPSVTELSDFLQKEYAIDSEEAKKIATSSKSVRSAILSTKNKSINTLLSEEQSPWDIVRSIQRRELKVPLNITNFRWIYKSLRGPAKWGTIHDFEKVMKKFSEFNYRIKVKHEEIDPFFVNSMEEPIEKVHMECQFEKKKVTKQPVVKEIKAKETRNKPEVKLSSPLDEWSV
jgi:hypothetical protein